VTLARSQEPRILKHFIHLATKSSYRRLVVQGLLVRDDFDTTLIFIIF